LDGAVFFCLYIILFNTGITVLVIVKLPPGAAEKKVTFSQD